MRRWFLPETPDMFGLLAQQGAVVVRGMDALCAWSNGDPSQAAVIRDIAHQGEMAGRGIMIALKSAFVTAISPEDIYELSERLDSVLEGAKNLVREAELLRMDADPPMVEMAGLVSLGVRDLVGVLPGFLPTPTRPPQVPTPPFVASSRSKSSTAKPCRPCSRSDDLHEVSARRELYRRYARISDGVVGVAHRVWYAVVKEA